MRSLLLTLIIFPYFSFCQEQKDYYLNLFGNKYLLKDSVGISNDINNILIKSDKKPVYYKFCGKGFINKEQISMANIDNPFVERIKTKSYFDSCVNTWILDSTTYAQLNEKTGFHIYKNDKKYSVYSFTILLDSSEIEEKYINKDLSLGREIDQQTYYPNFAEDEFKNIIEEYKNCNKFLLKDITYVDVVLGKKYKMDFSFLIVR